MSEDNISRRQVLKGVGAGVATAAAAGHASGDGSAEVLVGVDGRGPAKQVASQADDHAGTLDLGDVRQVVHGNFPSEAIQGLQNNPHVEYVEENSEYHALAQDLPWGIDRVDADVLHSNGNTGSGVDIAILDTGIDDDHPDLQENVKGGKAFGDIACGSANGCRYGAKPNNNDCNYAWSDDNDHGTHCAGTANAVNNSEGVVGVSTQANLYAGKVLDGCGSGTLAAIADGIRWAADNFDVASMSLGASSGDQTLRDAVQYADSQGLVMIAAAGNSGPCTDCVGYPAAYPEVIAVSSTASDDSLSEFSSTGPEVDIAAPGTDIKSTVPSGYATFSGTSMACPHVSGAAAQVIAAGTSPSNVRQTLTDTTENVGLASNESGAGLLDAEAAVGGSGGGTDDTTAPTAPSNLASTGHTSSSVSLSWDASSDDGTGVDHYNVYVDGSKATESTDTSETVSGLSASTTYDFYVTAVDGAGNESSASNTVSVTTDESTSSGPAIDQFSVGNASNGGWARFDVSWTVSDADGDLASVDLTLDQNGTADSASYSVSGSSASGSTRLQDKKGSGSYDVTLTVTDAAGNSTSQTTTVSA